MKFVRLLFVAIGTLVVGTLAAVAVVVALVGERTASRWIAGPSSGPPWSPGPSFRRAPAPAPDDDSWWSPVTVKAGEHFRVTSEAASETVVAAALEAAEAAWPATAALVGGDPPRLPGKLLEIRLLRSRGDYRAPDAGILSDVHMKSAAGWADTSTHVAYATLDSCGRDDESMSRFGPGPVLATMVGHEAAHLVAGLCFRAEAGCPWLDEGVAMCVEERVLTARSPAPSADADPRFSSAMQHCRRLADAGRLPDVRSILGGRVNRLSDAEYAIAWAFVRFLREPAQAARSAVLFARVRPLPPSESFESDVERVFESVWTDGALDELTLAWRSYVDAFAPQWDTYGPVETSGSRWTQIAARGSGTEAWRTAASGEGDRVIAGTFEILEGGTGDVAVLLMRTKDGGIGVEFRAGEGVGVYERTAAANTWLRFEPYLKPSTGTRTEFRIAASGDEVRVTLDGREVVRSGLGGRRASGPWGVAAFDGSAVVWDGVRLE